MARILAFTDPHGKLDAAAAILEMADREKPDLGSQVVTWL